MNRRSSITTSTSAAASASAKRPAAMENAAKLAAATGEQAKKRVALGNISNHSNVARNPARPLGAKSANVGILGVVSLAFFSFYVLVRKDLLLVHIGYRCFLLTQVAEEYRLVPDTLYLTVNYIDRYLSGNEINRQRLQLLGVACMLIAA
ncbi:hypothetical protein B296_00042945 [Ensete ventricosum]|uniref:Cyclin N-terminal domain-containing protein n=1 Tax=Ensete ventricosum TaxID=4639 RepID=A0A426Z9R2_ENSVE|nr:hypothetical protein B296_00042945 [Ensete ventricosum]